MNKKVQTGPAIAHLTAWVDFIYQEVPRGALFETLRYALFTILSSVRSMINDLRKPRTVPKSHSVALASSTGRLTLGERWKVLSKHSI